MKILPGPLLSELTTIRLGGRARTRVVVESEDDLAALPEVLEREAGRDAGIFIIGGGSNILASDGDLPVALLSADFREDFEIVEESAESVTVRVGAGMGLPRLLGRAQALGLSGLEPVTGVPGTVGGAAAMNAGSHGWETLQDCRAMRIWTRATGAVWLKSSEWTAGYRRFEPISPPLAQTPERLILALELTLRRSEPGVVKAAMQSHYARKKAVQPILDASAGCAFKNPPGESAGRLLDQAGMRGRRLGAMQFSERHANFLVNLGRKAGSSGQARQAWELIELGREAVRQRFGVSLELEVRTCP